MGQTVTYQPVRVDVDTAELLVKVHESEDISMRPLTRMVKVQVLQLRDSVLGVRHLSTTQGQCPSERRYVRWSFSHSGQYLWGCSPWE